MFGFDMMVGTDFNVWALECNAMPTMELSTGITKKLVPEVLRDLLYLTFLNDEDKCEGRFELLEN